MPAMTTPIWIYWPIAATALVTATIIFHECMCCIVFGWFAGAPLRQKIERDLKASCPSRFTPPVLLTRLGYISRIRSLDILVVLGVYYYSDMETYHRIFRWSSLHRKIKQRYIELGIENP